MATKKEINGKRKKKKDVKNEPVVPQIVTKTFADNVYTGLMQKGSYGSEILECPSATYTWRTTGVKYEGPFVASHINGNGKFSWPDGSTYEGELVNGKRHGEGIYVAPGGIPTYEGQWCMGKRNGKGKLAYDSKGSLYDGQWSEGDKDGEGYQVWPSGNIYRGQWKSGKMRGDGTMLWTQPTGLEEYSGSWVDNQPHGEGTHIWHSSPSTAPGKPANQQLNNRYSGQFNYGNREGIGTFYYANGSYYHGGWKNHQKSGQGRHTFEEGRYEEGIFLNDRMYGSPTNTGHVVDPPGYDKDNPICRCTDLSDLAPFAYPQDCSGLASNTGTGYATPDKIFREVYNILLRHIGEFKDVYARYRVSLTIPGEDPFTLASVKLWAFARDVGVLTPLCPLARFNRAMWSGPRNHREVSPDDQTDIRPVTPRSAESRRFSLDGPIPEPLPPQPDPQSRPESRMTGTEMSEAGESSIAASSPRPGGIGEIGHSEEHSFGAPSNGELPDVADVSLSPAIAESKFFYEAEWLQYTAWRRCHGANGLVSPHAQNRPLLFRQFLDGLVRVSAARYPHERGLEVQMHRYVHELAIPGFDKPMQSEQVFAPLVISEVREILDTFAPVISQLFREPHTIVEPPIVDEDDVAKLGVSVQKVPCARGVGDYGAVQRKLHLQGRLDLTLRVKDVLHILKQAGLLRPLADSPVSKEDPYTTLFPTPMPPAPERAASATEEELCLLAAVTGDEAGAGDASEGNDAGDSKRKTSKGSAPPPESAPSSPPTISAADFANSDLRFSFTDVCRLLGDGLTPGSMEMIKLALDPTDPEVNAELISLLEYMETEVTIADFERLAVSLADACTRQDKELCEKCPLHMRADGFLRHVFAPALIEPYMPPQLSPSVERSPTKEEEAEPAEDEAAAAEGETAADAPAESADVEPVTVAEDAAESAADEFWTGFVGVVEARNLARAPRGWPGGYESMIADW